MTYTPPAEAAPAEAQDDRPARRPRAPRAEGPVDTAQALPGFLTRSAAPAPAAPEASEEAGEAPAPKRRAPRKKVEAAADGE